MIELWKLFSLFNPFFCIKSCFSELKMIIIATIHRYFKQKSVYHIIWYSIEIWKKKQECFFKLKEYTLCIIRKNKPPTTNAWAENSLYIWQKKYDPFRWNKPRDANPLIIPLSSKYKEEMHYIIYLILKGRKTFCLEN